MKTLDYTMENMKELQDYIAYRKKLEDSRKQRSTNAFFNDSAVHEEFVIKELFTNAIESSPKINTIYMYCGKMSAFRDEMKDLVDEKRNELKPDDSATDEEKEEWNDFNPYSKAIAKMEDFFKEGGHLEVIVDDDVSSIVEESIWRDTLSRYYYNTKQLTINRLCGIGGVEHFIVCGNAYRSELSHKDKTAICCFNDPVYANLLYANFSFLQMSSRPAII